MCAFRGARASSFEPCGIHSCYNSQTIHNNMPKLNGNPLKSNSLPDILYDYPLILCHQTLHDAIVVAVAKLGLAFGWSKSLRAADR